VSLLMRLPLAMASPGGQRGRLSILYFHRVLERHDPLWPDIPDADAFETQMRWVRSWFNVLPLDEATMRLREGGLPPRALSITFDDGYADNETVAAPILHRLGMSATVFVTTGYLDGGVMWNDRVREAMRHCAADSIDLRPLGLKEYPLQTLTQRRQSIIALVLDIKHLDVKERGQRVDAIVARCGGREPEGLMMTTAQLHGLRRLGMGIGAHTVTHPILARLDAATARAEISDSKAQLEALLDRPVTLFAYPNGHPNHDYAIEHVRMVQACGFDAAVTTAPGAASAQSDRYQLPRVAPWDRTTLRYGARLLSNLRQSAETVA
jgi:peptidoglycan/xylan/chitin deacetylase (PgdA/CDA1 family)